MSSGQLWLVTNGPLPHLLVLISYRRPAIHLVVKIGKMMQSFSPILAGNSIYTQGFFQEITAFVNAVEGKQANVQTDLPSIEQTLQLIEWVK